VLHACLAAFWFYLMPFSGLPCPFWTPTFLPPSAPLRALYLPTMALPGRYGAWRATQALPRTSVRQQDLRSLPLLAGPRLPVHCQPSCSSLICVACSQLYLPVFKPFFLFLLPCFDSACGFSAVAASSSHWFSQWTISRFACSPRGIPTPPPLASFAVSWRCVPMQLPTTMARARPFVTISRFCLMPLPRV